MLSLIGGNLMVQVDIHGFLQALCWKGYPTTVESHWFGLWMIEIENDVIDRFC